MANTIYFYKPNQIWWAFNHNNVRVKETAIFTNFHHFICVCCMSFSCFRFTLLYLTWLGARLQTSKFKRCQKWCLHIHQRGSQQAEGWSHLVWWTCLWQNHSSKRKRKKTKREGDTKERRQMRDNPTPDSRALMLTCGCSHVVIAKSSFLLRFATRLLIHGNFLNTRATQRNDLPWVW